MNVMSTITSSAGLRREKAFDLPDLAIIVAIA